MKKLNLFKLLFCTMALFAATAFTSCVDDNEDNGLPYLEVTPETLTFDAQGVPADGVSTIQIKTNRPWKATVEDGKTWVRLSATEGTGSSTIEVSVPASNNNDQAKISISLYNNYAAFETKTVTVTQGEVKPAELVFKETFGTTGGSAFPYPTVAEYKGWDTTGEGAAGVTFSGENAQLRNSSPSNNQYSGYEGSGGTNLYFSAAPNDFIVKDITLPTGVTAYSLSFGAYLYNPPAVDGYYTTYSVMLSADGQKWTDPVPFTVKFVDGKSWNLATCDFQLTQAAEKLFVKISASEGNNRIDDVILNTGNGGTLVDLGKGGIGLTTNAPTDITATGATLSGAIASTEGITAVGFQYTVASAATIDWSGVAKTPAAAVATTFTKAVTGLTSGTAYVVRAYATTADGDSFGNVQTFTPQGGGGSVGDQVTTDFQVEGTWPAGFPASSADKQMGPAPFVFAGTTYTLAGAGDGGFYRGKEYQGTRYYLMLGKQGAYIELPANATKALTKVVCMVPAAASANVMVGVQTTAGVDVAGGAPVKWASQGENVDRTYTYDLTGTTANTKYRIYISNAYNAQFYKLELTYGEGGAATPAITVNPTSLSFTSAADNTGKTIAATVNNNSDTSLALYAVSSDNTQFPTTISGNTVTVKALENTTAQAKNATITIFLANSIGGTHVAEKTVAVTQSAAGASNITPISSVISGGAGKAVTIEGTLVGKSGQSIVVKDNTGLLYCFIGTAAAENVGDKIQVAGTTEAFGNVIQIGKTGVVVTKVSSGTYTQPSPEVFNAAAIDSYANGTAPLPVKYIQYTGTLSISGNYYNVVIDGATAKGSLVYAPAGLVDASLANKSVVVTGYAVGTPNSNRNYLNTVGVTVVEAGGSPTTPNISGLAPASLTWAADATNAQSITVNGSNLSGVAITATSSAGAASKFTIAVSGTTVTVTPKAANTGSADVTETLTVSAQGGNSTTAALKQSAPGGSQTAGYESMAQFVFPYSENSTPNAAYCLTDTAGNPSKFNGETATGIKFGTGKLAGVYTSPALGLTGNKTLSFYATGWTSTAATIYVRVNGGGSAPAAGVAAKANSTVKGNPPFTVTVTEADHYTVALTGLTAASTITISTDPSFAAASSTTARAIVCGIQVK